MHKFYKLKTPGVTSLLVVFIMGLFLTIMVAGIASLSLREQRQAANTDFSNRALQLAESAVKIATQELSSNPSYTKIGCPPDNKYSSLTGQNFGISCIEVKSNFDNSYEAYSEQDRSSQVFIGPDYGSSKSIRYLDIKWNNELDSTAEPYPFSGDFYPLVDDYLNPAGLELTFIWWPGSAYLQGLGKYLNQSDIKTATLFIMPGNQDKGLSAVNAPSAPVESKCVGQDSIPADLGSYKCGTVDSIVSGSLKKGFDLYSALNLSSTELTNIQYSRMNFAIRIKPRYSGTHFKAEFFNYANAYITNIQSASAKIDVTAKYGELYRRIVAEKEILPKAVDNSFDSVIYAGKGDNDSTNYDICKRLVVFASGDNKYSKAPSVSTCP